ncbi:MAG: glutaredoxin family protein [Methanomicrobiaceae archaeon]|uniref:Glutaredoxin family protein n=1 Tax=hydrocarbon metagenome TaxID=938273 RepID=A0A0W8FEL3_9ZZZZ|nr:glutaredoxin family protein [Methanomicrobiaceae archaeon]MDD5419439.1 glutaredoxin family protein [Methanomicrobiaceae archaeon]
MEIVHVPGKNLGKIMLYALSTCVWCGKTKQLLTDLGVEFSYLYVDLLEGEERARVLKEVEAYNPNIAFPTLVINDETVIVGYREDEIREALHAA